MIKEKLNKLRKMGSKTSILLLFFLGFIGVAAAAYAVINFAFPDSQQNNQNKSLLQNGNALQGSYQQKTESELLADLKKQQIIVTDKVSSQLLFPKGDAGTKGSWVVENPEANNVIMQCEIVYQGKTIATSTPISPGQHIESIDLSQTIPAGTYSVSANINYYNLNTKAYLSKSTYLIKMVIQ